MPTSKKKKKTSTRAFVAISTSSHSTIKEFTDRKGYTMGGFVERAALEKMENELKFEKPKK
jgi:hypothetical protein